MVGKKMEKVDMDNTFKICNCEAKTEKYGIEHRFWNVYVYWVSLVWESLSNCVAEGHSQI